MADFTHFKEKIDLTFFLIPKIRLTYWAEQRNGQRDFYMVIFGSRLQFSQPNG